MKQELTQARDRVRTVARILVTRGKIPRQQQGRLGRTLITAVSELNTALAAYVVMYKTHEGEVNSAFEAGCCAGVPQLKKKSYEQWCEDNSDAIDAYWSESGRADEPDSDYECYIEGEYEKYLNR